MSVKKLMLIKNENEIVMYCDTEREANAEIRKDPKYMSFSDLRDQSEYKIKVIAPYITNVLFTQIEGKLEFEEPKEGTSLKDIRFYFDKAGKGVSLGYNKCEIDVALSNGIKGFLRVGASECADLYSQVQQYMPEVWLGSVTKSGFVY